MRVIASGNLTVELIRAQRFDVAQRTDADFDDRTLQYQDHTSSGPQSSRVVDKVQLSPEALANDSSAVPCNRTNKTPADEIPTEQQDPGDKPQVKPTRLSPTVGSPALAGLGAAWVVPGTLLDVVA